IAKTQFAKGVIKNNVFIQTSSDQSNLNRNTTNIGYFRNPAMTSTMPHNTVTAIKPTVSAFKTNYPLKRPGSLPWDAADKPVIAYTLPPNMKTKLESALGQGILGSRSRTTKKMNVATTPVYEETALNGIIVQNFINHLSTTKSDIESTIPNPNQFFTTPTYEGDNMEPLLISNSNSFFPVNQGNIYYSNNDIKNTHGGVHLPPIVISRPANSNSSPDKQTMAHSPIFSTNAPSSSLPATIHPHITPRTPTQQPKINDPIKRVPHPTSNPLSAPTRRPPPVQFQKKKQQSVKVPTTTTFQNGLSPSIKVPVTNEQTSQSQASQPLVNVAGGMKIQASSYPQVAGQNTVPLILAPTKENSMNIYNALSPQQLQLNPLHPILTNSLNTFNAAIPQYPPNQGMSQPTPQIYN
ncbi:hypothetical protein Bhyg_10283, partial [Pseudolycoriella hygida]